TAAAARARVTAAEARPAPAAEAGARARVARPDRPTAAVALHAARRRDRRAGAGERHARLGDRPSVGADAVIAPASVRDRAAAAELGVHAGRAVGRQPAAAVALLPAGA